MNKKKKIVNKKHRKTKARLKDLRAISLKKMKKKVKPVPKPVETTEEIVPKTAEIKEVKKTTTAKKKTTAKKTTTTKKKTTAKKTTTIKKKATAKKDK